MSAGVFCTSSLYASRNTIALLDVGMGSRKSKIANEKPFRTKFDNKSFVTLKLYLFCNHAK